MAKSKASRSDVPEVQSTTSGMSWWSSSSRNLTLLHRVIMSDFKSLWHTATSNAAYVQDYVFCAPEPLLEPKPSYLKGLEKHVGKDLDAAIASGSSINIQELEERRASLDNWLKYHLLGRYLDDKAQFLLPDNLRPDEMDQPKDADAFKTTLIAYCRGLRHEDVIDIFYGLAEATGATLSSMEKHFYSREDKAKDRYQNIRNYLTGLTNDLLKAAEYCERHVNLGKPRTEELPPEPPKKWSDYVPTRSQIASATSTALILCVQGTKKTARFAMQHPLLTMAAVGYFFLPLANAATGNQQRRQLVIRNSKTFNVTVGETTVIDFSMPSDDVACGTMTDVPNNIAILCPSTEIQFREKSSAQNPFANWVSVSITAIEGQSIIRLTATPKPTDRFWLEGQLQIYGYQCDLDTWGFDYSNCSPDLVYTSDLQVKYYLRDRDPTLAGNATNIAGTDNQFRAKPFTGIVTDPDTDEVTHHLALANSGLPTPPFWNVDGRTGVNQGTYIYKHAGVWSAIQSGVSSYDGTVGQTFTGEDYVINSRANIPFNLTLPAGVTSVNRELAPEHTTYTSTDFRLSTGELFTTSDDSPVNRIEFISDSPEFSYSRSQGELSFDTSSPANRYIANTTVPMRHTGYFLGCAESGEVCKDYPLDCVPYPPSCAQTTNVTIFQANTNPTFTRGFSPFSTRVGGVAQQTVHANQQFDGDGDAMHCIWGMQDGSAMPFGSAVSGAANCTLKWEVQPGTDANTYNFIATLHDTYGGVSTPEVFPVFVQDQGVVNIPGSNPDIGSGPIGVTNCFDMDMPLSDPDHHASTAKDQLAAEITPIFSHSQLTGAWNTTSQTYRLCASPIAGQSGTDLTVIIAKSPASFTGRYHVTNPGPHQIGSLRLVTSEAGQPWSQSKAGICGHADPVLAESVSMNLPFLPAGLGQDANSVFATSTILPNTQSGPQQITATCTDARGATFTVFGTLESPFSKPTIEPVAPVTRQVDPTGLLPNPPINLDVTSLDGSIVTATLAPGSSDQLQRMVSFSGSVGTGAEHTGIQMHMHLSPGDNQPTGDAPYIVNALVQSVAGGTSTPFSFELGVPDQPLVITQQGQANFNIGERGTLRPLDSANDPDGTGVDFVDFVEPPELMLEPPLAPIVTRDAGSNVLGVRFPNGWNRHGPFNVTFTFGTGQQAPVSAYQLIDWDNQAPILGPASEQVIAFGVAPIIEKPTCSDTADGHDTVVRLSSSAFDMSRSCSGADDSSGSAACQGIPPGSYMIEARCFDITYTPNGTLIEKPSTPDLRTFRATLNPEPPLSNADKLRLGLSIGGGLATGATIAYGVYSGLRASCRRHFARKFIDGKRDWINREVHHLLTSAASIKKSTEAKPTPAGATAPRQEPQAEGDTEAAGVKPAPQEPQAEGDTEAAGVKSAPQEAQAKKSTGDVETGQAAPAARASSRSVPSTNTVLANTQSQDLNVLQLVQAQKYLSAKSKVLRDHLPYIGSHIGVSLKEFDSALKFYLKALQLSLHTLDDGLQELLQDLSRAQFNHSQHHDPRATTSKASCFKRLCCQHRSYTVRYDYRDTKGQCLADWLASVSAMKSLAQQAKPAIRQSHHTSGAIWRLTLGLCFRRFRVVTVKSQAPVLEERVKQAMLAETQYTIAGARSLLASVQNNAETSKKGVWDLEREPPRPPHATASPKTYIEAIALADARRAQRLHIAGSKDNAVKSLQLFWISATAKCRRVDMQNSLMFPHEAVDLVSGIERLSTVMDFHQLSAEYLIKLWHLGNKIRPTWSKKKFLCVGFLGRLLICCADRRSRSKDEEGDKEIDRQLRKVHFFDEAHLAGPVNSAAHRAIVNLLNTHIEKQVWDLNASLETVLKELKHFADVEYSYNEKTSPFIKQVKDRELILAIAKLLRKHKDAPKQSTLISLLKTMFSKFITSKNVAPQNKALLMVMCMTKLDKDTFGGFWKKFKTNSNGLDWLMLLDQVFRRANISGEINGHIKVYLDGCIAHLVDMWKASPNYASRVLMNCVSVNINKSWRYLDPLFKGNGSKHNSRRKYFYQQIIEAEAIELSNSQITHVLERYRAFSHNNMLSDYLGDNAVVRGQTNPMIRTHRHLSVTSWGESGGFMSDSRRRVLTPRRGSSSPSNVMRALRAATMRGEQPGKAKVKPPVESKRVSTHVAAPPPPPSKIVAMDTSALPLGVPPSPPASPRPSTATAVAALTLPSVVPAPPPPPAQPRRKREALVAAPQADEPLSRGRVGSDDSDGSDNSANSRTGLLHGT